MGKRRRSLRDTYWPRVDTLEGARYATMQAVWAAGFCAVVTALAASLAVFHIKFFQGIDAWAFVDAGIFAFLAVWLRRMSRAAAWVTLFVYVVERIYTAGTTGQLGANPVMLIIFVVAFISGVRGTAAWHRLTGANDSLAMRDVPENPQSPDPIG